MTRAVLGVALTSALAACTAGGGAADGTIGGDARGPDAAADTVATDTVRGTVAVVGADPVTHVVLRIGDGTVSVEGPATDGLRRVNGLGVEAAGRVDGAAMHVTDFRVREAEGLPAADGILEIHGDTAVLIGPGDERRRYTPVPASLRARAGARVWIAGQVGGEPQAWGVIDR